MKKILLLLVLTALAICLSAVFLFQRHQISHSTIRQPETGVSTTSPLPGNNQTSQIGHLPWLETNGQVPEGDRKLSDWQLAQTTSWWGKPLDPKEFWKGRVLWNDRKAMYDASRHGRAYPPIPYEDPSLPHYPNDEGVHGRYIPDSPNIFYASSSKESGFWDKFDKTHPRPPDQIEYQQQLTVGEYFGSRLINDFRQERETPEQIASFKEDIRTEPLKDNYPPEAFTQDALFWTYVQINRGVYQGMVDNGQTNWGTFQHFMSNLVVDSKYITEPLSPEQIQAESAWKIAYLQRLRREKTDEQYIQAYLQAWNLTESQVFGQQ